MGIAEAKLAQTQEAESAFHRSIELSNGHYASAFFGLGLILAREKKQYAEAETIVRRGLELDKDDGAGYFALAWILYATDRLPDAENAACEALLREPGLSATCVLLSEIHLRQGKRSADSRDLDSTSKVDANPTENAESGSLQILKAR
jgi:tetratricopeptide (TPR) repeat protein